MRCAFATALLIVPILLASPASAQNRYYLPQIANGNYGDGSYKTTFVLFNETDTDTTANLDLTDNDGNPLPMNLGGATATSFAIQLPAGASRMLQTDGQGSVVTGAASVTSSVNIGVSAIFSIYDANGNFLAETGVGDSAPLTSFVLPVDTTGHFNTGLALFNVNSATVTYTMTLRDTSGTQVGSPVQDNLQAHGHIARFVAGVNQLFPSIGSFQGTLLVQCSASVAATVLRQNSSPLSFTSLPAVSTSSTKLTLNLAQVANGSFGDGSYKMSFLIFNLSSAPANVSLALTDNDGNPLSLSIVGRGAGSRFDFSGLGPGASLFLQTDGAGGVVSGGATITSNMPIGASGIFTVLNAQGNFQTETGIGDSPVLTSLTLPVDITGSFDTGIAFFGANGAGSKLTFRLLDANGSSVGSSTTRDLAGNGHIAIFVSELFPGTAGFKGTLAVTATSGVAALTLRENTAPLSFTTLPVVAGTSTGQTSDSGSELLTKTETGINATSNVVKNVTLPSGFKLTGKVSGPGTANNVYASVGQILSYAGSVNHQTGDYLIILPAGTYNLSIGFTPDGVPSDEELLVAAQVATGIQISGDSSRDLSIPSVTLFHVSGVVTNLTNLPLAYQSTPAKVLMDSTGDPSATAQFSLNMTNGNYQGVLPAGTYSQGFNAFFATSGFQFQTLGLLTVATVGISGDTVVPPFAVPPTATLSGTVQGAIAPFGGISLTASNASGTVVGTSIADLTTAQYQMFLSRGVSYGVSVGVPFVQGSSLLGSMVFPLPAAALTLNQDTAGFNFTAPPTPALVTISGRVTDGSGKGVGSVYIGASSNSITGGQFSTFVGYGQTDADGNYSMTVFSGTNYQIFYAPIGQVQ